MFRHNSSLISDFRSLNFRCFQWFPKRSHTSSDCILYFNSRFDRVNLDCLHHFGLDRFDFILESDDGKSDIFEFFENSFWRFCKFRKDWKYYFTKWSFKESFCVFANGTASENLNKVMFVGFVVWEMKWKSSWIATRFIFGFFWSCVVCVTFIQICCVTFDIVFIFFPVLAFFSRVDCRLILILPDPTICKPEIFSRTGWYLWE
jgi:hypothetical protein